MTSRFDSRLVHGSAPEELPRRVSRTALLLAIIVTASVTSLAMWLSFRQPPPSPCATAPAAHKSGDDTGADRTGAPPPDFVEISTAAQQNAGL